MVSGLGPPYAPHGLLARTIADLADSAEIDTPHVAEALTYRPRQR
jgi:predicted ATPase with chaperone activity